MPKIGNNSIDSKYKDLINQELEIKSSASEVKVLMIFLLIAELFIAITTSTVTDLQLLLTNNSYAIPFLGFSINVVNFFVLAPIILLLIHYNLLSTLLIHCKKLVRYEKNKSEHHSSHLNNSTDNKKNDDIFSDFINRIYNNTNESERKYIHINCAILFSIFPILTQLYILIKFISYQSISISFMHLLIIILSCNISIFYWQRISNKKYLINVYNSSKHLLIRLILDIYLTNIHKTKRLPLKLYTLMVKAKILSRHNYIFLTTFSFIIPLIIKSIILYSILWASITIYPPDNYNFKNIISTYIINFDRWAMSVICLSSIIIICRGYKSTLAAAIILGSIIRYILIYNLEYNIEFNIEHSSSVEKANEDGTDTTSNSKGKSLYFNTYYNADIFIYIYACFIAILLLLKTTTVRNYLDLVTLNIFDITKRWPKSEFFPITILAIY